MLDFGHILESSLGLTFGGMLLKLIDRTCKKVDLVASEAPLLAFGARPLPNIVFKAALLVVAMLMSVTMVNSFMSLVSSN